MSHTTDRTERSAFATSGFARFIAGPAGRALRVVAGLAIIAAGLLLVGGTAGYIVTAIGLVPLFAGLLDFCVLGSALGAPLGGREIHDIQRRAA